jgi:hypothetical protein
MTDSIVLSGLFYDVKNSFSQLHRTALSHLSFKITKHLVDLFKAGKNVGVRLEDPHHITDLALVDDADQHIHIFLPTFFIFRSA